MKNKEPVDPAWDFIFKTGRMLGTPPKRRGRKKSRKLVRLKFDTLADALRLAEKPHGVKVRLVLHKVAQEILGKSKGVPQSDFKKIFKKVDGLTALKLINDECRKARLQPKDVVDYGINGWKSNEAILHSLALGRALRKEKE